MAEHLLLGGAVIVGTGAVAIAEAVFDFRRTRMPKRPPKTTTEIARFPQQKPERFEGLEDEMLRAWAELATILNNPGYPYRREFSTFFSEEDERWAATLASMRKALTVDGTVRWTELRGTRLVWLSQLEQRVEALRVHLADQRQLMDRALADEAALVTSEFGGLDGAKQLCESLLELDDHGAG